MAAFSKASDIPATINTVERLFVWVALLCSKIFPDQRINLTDTESVKQFRWTQFPAGDGEYYLYFEGYVKLDPTYVSDGTKKLWEFGQQVANVEIPAGYKS